MIALVIIQPAGMAQTEGRASDLTEAASSIETANPLLPDYQQMRQETLDQLNRRYEGLYNFSEESLFNNEDLDQLVEAINVRSTADDNSRSRRSVDIDLTKF
ncbi:hypothetical protein C7293_28695 [filamentous cyanobacterium CCT1]|nr:hypothetical protein C7293_28695 [filamentous cyanobacterium CCT1]